MIGEEERALLENMGLESISMKNGGNSKRNVSQKIQLTKKGQNDDPLTKPLAPDDMTSFAFNHYQPHACWQSVLKSVLLV